MKKRVILLLTVIPLVLLVSYLIKEYVHRYILAPILYTLRIERILYEALPQSVWWGIFLLIVAMIALHSLLRGRRSTSVEVESTNEQRMSRAKSWSRWIEMSQRGNYSKWLLARHFADLASNILVYQDRQPYERIRARILTNEEDIPSDIRDYLKVGLNIPSFRHYSEFLGSKSRLRLPSRYQLAHFIQSKIRLKSNLHTDKTLREGNALTTASLDLDPEVIVQFLETKIPPGGPV